MLNNITRQGLIISNKKLLNRAWYIRNNQMSTSGVRNQPVSEIKIPTPFGFIAGKQWGKPQGRPVLAIHGWQDNAGSFDSLIPNLDQNLRIVAIDLPGHGFSSHIPIGSHYNTMDMIYYLKTIVVYLKWNRFSLIGHSMGGGLSLLYSSLFPDEIDSVISLDRFKEVSAPYETFAASGAKMVKERLFMEKVLQKPEAIYTEDAALEKLLKLQGGSTDENSARNLLKRGVKPSADGTGVVFARDSRLKMLSARWRIMDDAIVMEYLRHLKCRLLVILASEGATLETEETWKIYSDMYSQNCQEFRSVRVEGTHHVHMNHPERVAPIINMFLNNSKL